MILSVHHAQITVPRGAEQAARAFYCAVLGLQEVPKPLSLAGRGGLWLQLGEIQIHVGTEDGAERLATKAHLAYEVSDLAYWRDRLREHVIEALDGVPLPGYARLEARVPFGNLIEFIQWLTELV